MTYIIEDNLPTAEGWEKNYRDVPSNAARTAWHAPGAPYVELNEDGTLYVSTSADSRGTTVGLPQDLVRDIAETALALPPNQEQLFAGTDCEAPFVLGVDTDVPAIAGGLGACIKYELAKLDNQTLLDLCADGGYIGRAAHAVYKARH